MREGIHIGQEIEARVNKLRMTKTEFGKRIGVPQQNVNRIFEKASIDTERLVAISNALDFNFFDLYSGNVSIRDVERSFNPGQNDAETIQKLTDIIEGQRKRIDELTDKLLQMTK